MPIREKRIYSGDILEIEIYPISDIEKRKSRKEKRKESTKSQKNLNEKNATKKITRSINVNFTEDDYVAHMTYDKKHLPLTVEDARNDVKKYIRRLRYHYKKDNLPSPKYIAVIEEPEKGKKKGRLHHHLIISGGLPRDKIEELWGKGRCNVDRLQPDEFGYEGLARYISKDPKGKKRWIPSRNLEQPKIEINDSKYTKRKVEKIANNPEDRYYFEKQYPGYIFNQCEVQLNEINGGWYLTIKMRMRGS